MNTRCLLPVLADISLLRRMTLPVAAGLLLGLAGCRSATGNVGVSVPLGGNVNIGVGVNTNGTISGSASTQVGGVSVGVGTSAKLPSSKTQAAPQPAADSYIPIAAPQ